MKSKEYILSTISKHRKKLSEFGVRQIGLFGSYAKESYDAQSDIDLLVDFEPSHETYDNLISVCDFIESVFEGEKIEVVTKGGLSPYIGSYILKDAVFV